MSEIDISEINIIYDINKDEINLWVRICRK